MLDRASCLNKFYLMLMTWFQVLVDKLINIRVTAVQSLETLQTFIFCSHYGGQKNAHQPNFPYNLTKNYPTSLVRNSVFIGPNNFKFGTKTRYIVLQAISKCRGN